jgi:hypothetical protein
MIKYTGSNFTVQARRDGAAGSGGLLVDVGLNEFTTKAQ